jgi:hypothetical protein
MNTGTNVCDELMTTLLCLCYLMLKVHFCYDSVMITFLFLHPYHLISWSYLLIFSISHSRPFHGLLLITHWFHPHADLYCSHQFHLCFTVVSLWFHFLLWCFITFYEQPHLVVYIFSSLHCPVLTLSISRSVIDAHPSLAYGFSTEYWPHLVIQSA